VVLEPTSAGLAPSRVVEALVGGGVALAVSALAFPPDPVLVVRRSAQGIFSALGQTLEELAAALADRDSARAEAALHAAREIDGDVRALDVALDLGRETARFSIARRSSHGELDRYQRGARHIDFAVRNTRVLARHVARFLRNDRAVPAELHAAMHDLSLAVWALAADLDDPARSGEQVRLYASRAAARAVDSFESDRDLGLAEIAAQVRSTAIDLVRAGEVGRSPAEPDVQTPTEELLIQLPAPA
jgi:uncharacterized membrane protein YgaE (UPF0421/DUF939 family)